jgi:hypothetical protein
MLDTIPNLENWMVPIYKDWERTAIPLHKYFYDISVFLSVNKIQDLLHMGNWVHILKDRRWIKFSVDLDMLDKRYLINKDSRWQLHQMNKYIPIPKPEVTITSPVQKIWEKPSKKEAALEARVAELEKIIIKHSNLFEDLNK